MLPIPEHLREFAWYAAHQAWVKEKYGLCRHDPGDAQPAQAMPNYLSGRSPIAGISDLHDADLRGIDLRSAFCRGASFVRADLRDANLVCADLGGTDLREADLRGANLCDVYIRDSNLTGAKFDLAVPVVPTIDAVIAAELDRGCELVMSDWHSCDTAHCRAGWAVHVAGEAGYELEEKTGAELAGTLIYEASRPGVPAPNFYADDDDALADLMRCAEEQGYKPREDNNA